MISFCKIIFFYDWIAFLFWNTVLKIEKDYVIDEDLVAIDVNFIITTNLVDFF